MTTQELRVEINTVLQSLEKKELAIVLNMIKQIQEKSVETTQLLENLQKIIQEDGELLKRLAE